MSISSENHRQKDLKIVPLPENAGFENPCPIVSVTDLTPEKHAIALHSCFSKFLT
jgi:hypothetical protein